MTSQNDAISIDTELGCRRLQPVDRVVRIFDGGDDCVVTDIYKVFQVLPQYIPKKRDAAPAIYHIQGHGIGWLLADVEVDVVDPTTFVTVRLLSGDTVTVPTTNMEELIY